jgi:hypothetical protein
MVNGSPSQVVRVWSCPPTPPPSIAEAEEIVDLYLHSPLSANIDCSSVHFTLTLATNLTWVNSKYRNGKVEERSGRGQIYHVKPEEEQIRKRYVRNTNEESYSSTLTPVCWTTKSHYLNKTLTALQV